MLYNTTANFYPAMEQKNNYIGRADITVANAIKLRGIAVFVNDEGNVNLYFPTYNLKNGAKRSYIWPVSEEALADMTQVVTDAIADMEHHFGHASGKYSPLLKVTGHLVDEPYADARFSLEVEGFCTLNGISTREVEYAEDGKVNKFVAVDMPTLQPYVNKDNETVYPPIFEGLNSKYETQDGKKKSKDYGDLIRGLILAERKNLMERKPELDDSIAAAKDTKAQKKAPAKTKQKSKARKEPAPEK